MSQSSEHDEQTELFRCMAMHRNTYPQVDLAYAVPNASKRTKWERGRLLDEGMKAGVPDICLPVARGGYHALYIEMKYLRNVPTLEQASWIERLRAEGNRVEVCYSWIDAWDVIRSYLSATQPPPGHQGNA